MIDVHQAIVKAYRFSERIEMLKNGEFKNHFVIRSRCANTYIQLRQLAEASKLNILEARWLNGHEKLDWVSLPNMVEQVWSPDYLLMEFDLRDLTITVKLDESAYIESHSTPLCCWKIKGNLRLFKSLIEHRVNDLLLEMLERAYNKELADAKTQGMARICAQLHQQIGVAAVGS